MLLWIGLGLTAFIVIAGAAVALAIYKLSPAEVLPDHLGLFLQSEARDRLDEVRKQDFANAIDAKNALIKDDTLPTLPASPMLLLYADGRDLNINDMRLVQLDTLKEDGSMKQLDFQVAQVDGKPDMKRLRVPAELANGKYAFAVFDTYIDEGKQKLWPFQVRNSPRSDNGDALKSATVAVKPKPTPTGPSPNFPRPLPTLQVPLAANMARSRTANLILRSGPSQSYPKVRNLAYGEVVEVLGYSSNYESFKGLTGRFVQVRTTGGQVGWAFEPYLGR